jgi:PAS domain S-box-containing protein
LSERTSSPVLQCVTDKNMRIIDASVGLAEMLHITETGLCGMDVIAVTHPDDRPHNLDRLADLHRADQPFSIVKRYVRSDATTLWVRNHVRAGPTDGGKPTIVATIEILDDPTRGAGRRELAVADRMIKLRAMRSELFRDAFASEPTLDMMLVLFAREERGLKSTVSTMCRASDAPYATAHRRFSEAVDAGLVTTAFDTEDKRLVVVCLTPIGKQRVRAFLQLAERLTRLD